MIQLFSLAIEKRTLPTKLSEDSKGIPMQASPSKGSSIDREILA